MLLACKLALRYACSRWVNLAAVLAVALALIVQIVVMSVLDGMILQMQARVRDTGEQVTIGFVGTLPDMTDVKAVQAAVADIPGVRGMSPKFREFALADHVGWHALVQVHGIDLAEEWKYSALRDYILLPIDPKHPKWFGSTQQSHGRPGIFLSHQVKQALNVEVGDEVVINFTSEMDENSLRRKHFTVANVFTSGNPLLDQMGAFIPIEEARELFTPGAERSVVARFSFWLDDPMQAREMAQAVRKATFPALRNTAGMRYYSTVWLDEWKYQYDGMKYENNLQELVLALMNLSSGFCVFAILATLVSRRVRDVGLLRCIGASRGTLVLAFLLVGFLIGVVGAGFGVAGGYFCAPRVSGWHEYLFDEPLYPPRMFGTEGVKAVIQGWKVWIYAGGAVLISTLAAIYPAFWAGWREPVEALRDE